IGAGDIFRQRHLPNLRQIEGVEVRVVCNRSEASGRRIAGEFGIAEVETDWRRLLERDDLDAIMIGTWPYRHKEMSVAALDAGKHVFCQARMAMDLAEARQMVQAVEAHPQLVHMICPPPHRMPWEPYIRHLIDSDQLGQVRSVRVASLSDANLKPGVSWRERVEYSGKQVLAVGIWAETLNAWLGEYDTLAATTATPIPAKTDDRGQPYAIRIPQIVLIQGTLRSGAAISEHHSGVAGHERADQVTIDGSKGTLRVDIRSSSIWFAPLGRELRQVDVPADLKRDWQVERDFIEAVRAARQGRSWSVSPDFHEGLRYMKKVEAIHQSAQSGETVRLDQL
ncbi:MAG TPA: Gfo/Idh/MocA family oxidoreductase, partial [Phycisphaeraceae bacterium]